LNLDPVSEREWGFLLITLEFREEKPAVKVKNVGKGEGIFRLIIGVILIILAFFISGVFRWILGLIGVVVILTAIFGY
jgi:predicted phage tail protein